MTEEQKQQATVGSVIGMQIVVFVIAIIGIRWADIELVFDSNQLAVDILIGAVAGIVSYFALLVLVRMENPVSGKIRETSKAVRGAVSQWGYAAIVIVSLSAAIGEESLFRVFIQTWIGMQLSTWIGVLLGALAFGLAHMASITYFVISAVLGIAIGCAYAISGSIILIVTWHFVYDVLALTVIINFPTMLRLQESDD